MALIKQSQRGGEVLFGLQNMLPVEHGILWFKDLVEVRRHILQGQERTSIDIYPGLRGAYGRAVDEVLGSDVAERLRAEYARVLVDPDLRSRPDNVTDVGFWFEFELSAEEEQAIFDRLVSGFFLQPA
jgi:hypothetical protein